MSDSPPAIRKEFIMKKEIINPDDADWLRDSVDSSLMVKDSSVKSHDSIIKKFLHASN